MFQRCVFADATSPVDGSDFVFLGAPFDSTSCFRTGSRYAPDSIRQASYNFETYYRRYGLDLEDLRISDAGNLEFCSDPGEYWETLRSAIPALPKDAAKIVLGGDHSITPPVVEALARKGEIGVVVFDAHLDLRESFGGTEMSHACTSRRILEILNGDLSRYVSIGIRSGSKEEYAYAEEIGLKFYSSFDVEEIGIDQVLKSAAQHLSPERLYLSIDFDVLDPAYAPGVGNPEPFGISPADLRRAIELLAPKAIGLDITEISPPYDHGVTALLGARMAREFIAAKAARM
jgi:agmatinase